MKNVKKMLICALTLICISIPVAASANTFNGGRYLSSSNNVTGAYAYITYPELPHVYNNSASSIWVMIDESSTGALAQVGYAVDPPTENYAYYFFGMMDQGGDYAEYTTGYGPAVGTTHEFEVTATGNRGTVKGYIDGQQYWQQEIDWDINDAEYFEEIASDSAQLIGTRSNPAIMSDIYTRYNGSWIHPKLSVYTGTSIKGIDYSQYTTAYKLKLWDARY